MAEPVDQLFLALQKKLDVLQEVVPEDFPRIALAVVTRVQAVVAHRFAVIRQETQTKAARES